MYLKKLTITKTTTNKYFIRLIIQWRKSFFQTKKKIFFQFSINKNAGKFTLEFFVFFISILEDFFRICQIEDGSENFTNFSSLLMIYFCHFCFKLKNFHKLTVFENHPKCRIWVFQFWHFSPIFVLLKLTCLVTLFDRKLQIFKNSPKWTIFGIFN